LLPPSVSLHAASVSAIAANAVRAKMPVDAGCRLIAPRPKARANARLHRWYARPNQKPRRSTGREGPRAL